MDSDSDIDCDLPPGWELSTFDEKPYYINHINNTKHFEHPLKKLKTSSKSRLSESFIQKFDSFSTSEKVLKNKDCSNDVAIIVGGCSGVGLEIVFHLSSLDCKLILGCPDVVRCTKDILVRTDSETFQRLITVLKLDLSSLKSVKEFCKIVLGQSARITMVVLSAAVMCPPFCVTEDGFESSFQINCLSQFYIALTLLQSMTEEDLECRILFIACESHRAVKELCLSDLRPTLETYDGYYTYALTNLLKIIITRQLPLRFNQCNIKVKPRIFVCHPGNMIHNTKINRHSPKLNVLFWLCSSFTKNLSQAAATPLFCLTSSSVKKYSGYYFNNGCICEPSMVACDKKIADLIWNYLFALFLNI